MQVTVAGSFVSPQMRSKHQFTSNSLWHPVSHSNLSRPKERVGGFQWSTACHLNDLEAQSLFSKKSMKKRTEGQLHWKLQ